MRQACFQGSGCAAGRNEFAQAGSQTNRARPHAAVFSEHRLLRAGHARCGSDDRPRRQLPIQEARTGDYWVAATIGNKEYKVLVRFVPGKKGSTLCSAFLYVFEKGQLQLRRTETVSVN
jgi:hypothetical protein